MGVSIAFRIAVALLAALCLVSLAASPSVVSPVGTWRVIGDSSGEPEALVSIRERDGILEGQIIAVFSRPGVDPNALCEQCSGSRKNQPVRGMTILTGLRYNGDEYSGGEILDPETGDIYRCTLRLSPDNRTLYLRGFLGIPLIGRTQTWIRE